MEDIAKQIEVLTQKMADLKKTKPVEKVKRKYTKKTFLTAEQAEKLKIERKEKRAEYMREYMRDYMKEKYRTNADYADKKKIYGTMRANREYQNNPEYRKKQNEYSKRRYYKYKEAYEELQKLTVLC